MIRIRGEMKALECKQTKYSKFSKKSNEHNSWIPSLILLIIELAQEIVAIYIVTKFDEDW